MSISEYFLIVAGLAILTITIFLIPVLIQLRRIGEKAEGLLDNLNQEIPPLLKNVNQSAAELTILTNSLNRKVEEVEQILSLARNASDNLLHTSDLFKKTLLPIITKIGSFGAGLYAFISFIRKSRQNN
jgi:uncharacterized protein YoxC